MKLEIKNIGRLYNKTEIDINGITILTGENGVGKSTVGKALYCVFNTFYDYERQIEEERSKSIFRIIRFMTHKIGSSRTSPAGIYPKISELVDDYSDLEQSGKLTEKIKAIIGNIGEEDLQELTKQVILIMQTSNEDILDGLLNRRIAAEFPGKIGHVNYTDKQSEIRVKIKADEVLIDFEDDKAKINRKMSLLKDLVYIDDPYIIDSYGSLPFNSPYLHQMDLLDKFLKPNKNPYSVVDDVLLNQKIQHIYTKLGDVCDGELSPSENGLVYKGNHLNGAIPASNLSAGLKSFMILKSLLQDGYLEEDGIVVLDEPEIHLHPEWLAIYAEIIVLLQDVLHINFVISTHSVDFISFIELYSKKYKIEEKCVYYMFENDENDNTVSKINNVTDNLDKIYSKLSLPFLRTSEELNGTEGN